LLSQSINEVKGVGEKVRDQLNAVGIYTVEDALFYFPYRYKVFEIKPLQELIHDENVTIEGRVVHDPSLSYYGRKKSRLMFTVEVENVAVKAVMFNRAFAKKHIHQGDIITLTGKWDMHRLQITVQTYKKGHLNESATIQPMYSVKGDLTQARLKKLIQEVMKTHLSYVIDILPERYRDIYKLPAVQSALQTMHDPENKTTLKHAKRRFIYEEFLLFQLKMQLLRKLKREATLGNQIQYNPENIRSFIKNLPYILTDAQENVLNQILSDMKSFYRMNRLLQGDVGSGKTAVAAICLYAAITAGKQGAFMVPTEILANQHFHSLKEMFGNYATITLLTSSVKGKERVERLEAIRNNDTNIVVGTHALIQEDVQFDELGFVIVDEQHRFGVEQRRALREKGLHPDVLFMTATPIPRTLAITAFGDMDVSIIDEMPKGRQTIETYWVRENMLDRVLTFVRKRIENGEQAYVVCPLIEESDKLDIQNAVELYHLLQDHYPDTIQIGLMHGRLETGEKEEVMKAFEQNELQVLVSTTVVEVGVNIPNATTMIIYDAQRFGLSQLHQLRGRVGRGEKKSYCILIADPKGETGKERMQIMTETNDGFELSEKDLKLRGPGDFFGKKQSGVPEFKVADMIHDYRALETARQDAGEIIEKNLLDTDESYKALKEKLENQSFLHEKLD